MLTKSKLIIATILGVVSSLPIAQAQTVGDFNGSRNDRTAAATQYRTVGSPIDRDGWRFWNGNWDGTCFRTLDHLRSADACSR